MALTMQASIGGLKAAQAAQQQPLCSKHSLVGTTLQSRRTCAPAKLAQRMVTTASGITIPPIKKLGEEGVNDAVNAIRFLSIDGVNAAKSGHPGLPMGCVLCGASATVHPSSLILRAHCTKGSDRVAGCHAPVPAEMQDGRCACSHRIAFHTVDFDPRRQQCRQSYAMHDTSCTHAQDNR